MKIVESPDLDVKRLVRRHWDDRAAAFDDKPNHGLHSEQQRQAWLAVLRRLTGSSTLRVLDVGCGTGFLTLLLAELGHRVTGVDLAPEMLVQAREKATAAGLTVEWRLSDAEVLDDPNHTYDLIVERHLIWTLPNPGRAVQEWLRVLRPGGRLALIEGHWENQSIQPEYETIRHRLPFYGGVPSEQLARFLQAEGLPKVAVQPLMDAALWGERPQRPRYLLIGRQEERAAD